MNRQQRRTRGLWISERLATLKNSSLLQEADLKDIPKEDLDLLIAGTHPNKTMQRKYRSINKILGEILELTKELRAMQLDLDEKQKKSNAR